MSVLSRDQRVCFGSRNAKECWIPYRYINTSGNWENEKLCGNTTPEGRSVFTQYRVFPISTSVDITIYQYGKNVLYLFYNIAQRNIKKEIFQRFRVDIELYQHGS